MKMDTREDRVFAQFQKVCQKVWLSSKSMPVYITLKKCSTQYVAHFMWLTKSLKIGEYATICSTLYVLPKKNMPNAALSLNFSARLKSLV